MFNEAAPLNPPYTIEKLDILLQLGSYVYFVFTSLCFLYRIENSCCLNTIGLVTFCNKDAIFLPELEALNSIKWSLD